MPLDPERVKAARERALGRNVKLARIHAHKAFDKIWRKGIIPRSRAYAWLAKEFGRDEIHMKWMTIAECKRVVELVKDLLDGLHDKEDSNGEGYDTEGYAYSEEGYGPPRNPHDAREALGRILRGRAGVDTEQGETDR